MVGEIVGESIKSAIAKRIRTAFQVTSGTPPVTTYPTVYKEEIPEGFVRPSFFIETVEVNQRRIIREVYERTYLMNIRHHAAIGPKTNEDLELIANKLLEEMATIEVPIFNGVYDEHDVPVASLLPVRGFDSNYNIRENVLQVYISYRIRAKKLLPAETPMAVFESTENLEP